ncbi:MAG TPA: surface-adhesin E family protein [Gemmatimonadaceae bacterium]
MHSKIIPALFAAALLTLPAAATAQKATKTRKTARSSKSWTPSGAWRSVYSDASVRVAVDTSQTQRQSDGTYRVRLRWQYATNQAIGTRHAYRTMVDRKLIDCSTQGIKPISAETYDAAGKPVAGYDTTDAQVSELDWAKRPPGSSAGKAYAAVCGAIRK